MARIVVNFSFNPPLTEEQADAEAKKVDKCLSERDGRWLMTHLSADRRKQVCMFEAPDAESVREAFRFSGVKFDDVWLAGQWWEAEK